MKYIKKVLLIIMIFCSCFTLISCNNGEEELETKSPESAEQNGTTEEKIPVEEVIFTEEDFRFTVLFDKEAYHVGDQIDVTVKLTNLSGKDILVEIPDSTANMGGKSVESVIQFNCAPKSSDVRWDVDFSIAVVPRPRTVFRKDATIEKTFEYTVTEKENLKWEAKAIYFYGVENENRFEKQIILKNSSELVIVEE